MCSDCLRDRLLLCKLIRGRRLHRWFSIPHATGFALFIQIVEERKELIVLALGERIELVVMAAGTTERDTHQDCRCCVNTISHVFNPVFFRDDSPFRIDHMVSIEARGNPLIERRFGKQVACQLFRHKLVKGDSFV